MRWPLVLACLVLGPVPALAEDPEWTCVPGEQGRWRCGLGEQVPEAVPLSPLEPRRGEPAPARGPAPSMIPGVVPNPFGEPGLNASPEDNDQPSPLARNAGSGTAPADATGPAEQPRFSLAIVSLGDLESTRRFVRDFELAPDEVRYTLVEDGGNVRHTLLFGEFSTRAQAQAAISALPSAIRSIQPRAVPIGDLETYRLSETPEDSAPRPAPAPVAALPQSTPTQPERKTSGPPPADTREPGRAGADESEDAPPRETAARDEPSPPPVQADSVAPGPTPRPAPEAVEQPESTPTAGTAAESRAPGASFAAIDAGRFTIQLGSLSSLERVSGFLARHGLDDAAIHRVLIDEGAGPRWLVLQGDYGSLREANQARALLPGSLRSPWARRVGPIQEGMIEFR